tara:strand:+ start:620 stop:892 length:273 start_codon:yes stop_codon:yes gene_type:complete
MMQINIDETCQFLTDLDNKQGLGVNRGVYNLICSKRDLSLFCKGIKPHRKWRLKDVKAYFGLFDTNGKYKIKDALDLLCDAVLPKEVNDG